MMDKTFYYILLITSFIGFLSCLYVYLHTKREQFVHKAMIIFEFIFLFVSTISILSLAGDFKVASNQILTLLIFSSIALFVGVLALKIGIEKYFRQMQVCKDKEFQRQMRKQYGSRYTK